MFFVAACILSTIFINILYYQYNLIKSKNNLIKDLNNKISYCRNASTHTLNILGQMNHISGRITCDESHKDSKFDKGKTIMYNVHDKMSMSIEDRWELIELHNDIRKS
jgi:hypothetical protein